MEETERKNANFKEENFPSFIEKLSVAFSCQRAEIQS